MWTLTEWLKQKWVKGNRKVLTSSFSPIWCCACCDEHRQNFSLSVCLFSSQQTSQPREGGGWGDEIKWCWPRTALMFLSGQLKPPTETKSTDFHRSKTRHSNPHVYDLSRLLLWAVFHWNSDVSQLHKIFIGGVGRRPSWHLCQLKLTLISATSQNLEGSSVNNSLFVAVVLLFQCHLLFTLLLCKVVFVSFSHSLLYTYYSHSCSRKLINSLRKWLFKTENNLPPSNKHARCEKGTGLRMSAWLM